MTGEVRDLRRWADVVEGEKVPRVELAVTYSKLILGATSAWDYFPGHHDPEYARAQGQRTIYVNTSFFEAFVDRVATDWAGPGAFITRRRLAIRESIYAGEVMFAEGRVTRCWVDDAGRHLADIDLVIGAGDEPRCSADATVWLR
jgi:acyl dehydratase